MCMRMFFYNKALPRSSVVRASAAGAESGSSGLTRGILTFYQILGDV